jgi:hypothetical protein
MKQDLFEGIIIEESLKDYRLLNHFQIIGFEITTEENPADRWHIFTVRGAKNALLKLASELKGPEWYGHFWNTLSVIVVFQNKTFEFPRKDFNRQKKTVIEYGKTLGIPEAQLDFPIPTK